MKPPARLLQRLRECQSRDTTEQAAWELILAAQCFGPENVLTYTVSAQESARESAQKRSQRGQGWKRGQGQGRDRRRQKKKKSKGKCCGCGYLVACLFVIFFLLVSSGLFWLEFEIESFSFLD